MLALLFSRLGGYAVVGALALAAVAYVRHLQASIDERDATIDAHRTALIAAQRNAHAFEQALRSTQTALLARDRALASIQARRSASAHRLRRTAERADVREVARLVVPEPLADVLREDDRARRGTAAAAVPAGGAAGHPGATADDP